MNNLRAGAVAVLLATATLIGYAKYAARGAAVKKESNDAIQGCRDDRETKAVVSSKSKGASPKNTSACGQARAGETIVAHALNERARFATTEPDREFTNRTTIKKE